MSLPTKDLTDVLKNAQTAVSLLNHSIPCINSSGTPLKTNQVIPLPTTPTCIDADLATPGWMRTVGNTLNLPKDGLGGFILTLQFDLAAKIQFFTQWSGGTSLFMRKHTSGSGNDLWTDWLEFAKVAV